MTISELSMAVRQLVPDASRVDVALVVRHHEQHHYRTEAADEVLCEVDVWYRSQFYGIEAPTYEDALERFRVKMLPKMGLAVVAPAAERLAAMETGSYAS